MLVRVKMELKKPWPGKNKLGQVVECEVLHATAVSLKNGNAINRLYTEQESEVM